MAGGRRSILIDARVNGFPGAYGLARSVMKLAAHMSEPDGGLTLRVLVDPRHGQIFPLSELPAYADLSVPMSRYSRNTGVGSSPG